jgi:hypothetical protein
MDHDELVNRRVAQIARDHGVTIADRAAVQVNKLPQSKRS